jgi:integrase
VRVRPLRSAIVAKLELGLIRNDLRQLERTVLSGFVMRERKYRPHSSGRFALVEVDGKRIRLPGKVGSDESLAAYHEICRRLHQREADPLPPPPPKSQLLLTDLCLRYVTHCESLLNGTTDCTAYNNLKAVKKLLAFIATGLACEFGPKKLKEFQAWLIANPRIKARSYANVIVGRVRGMFSWAVSEELIEETVYRALTTVKDIRPGAGLRELRKRQPVPPEDVEATIAHLWPHLAAAVRLHSFTGVRSRSVCLAKPGQFDCSPAIWLWRPRHKSEKYGKELIVPIGPKCQAAIGPLLQTKQPGDYLFSPRDVSSNRRYKEHYTATTYAGAIGRAIKKANKARKAEKKPLIPHWHPHRLRHTLGTLVNDRWGHEAAKAMLGHATDMTKIYTAQRVALATQIAAEIG